MGAAGHCLFAKEVKGERAIREDGRRQGEMQIQIRNNTAFVLGRKVMPGLLYLGKDDFTIVTEVVSPSVLRCCQGSDN